MILISAIGLSIVLIISLRRIRSYTKTLVTSGMIPDEKLLMAQEAAFLIAAFLCMIVYPVSFFVSFHSFENEKEKETRYEIA